MDAYSLVQIMVGLSPIMKAVYQEKSQNSEESNANNEIPVNVSEEIDIEKARIIKEIAIAQRINNSEEVEIEEFYDGKIDGGVDIGVNQNGGKAGINAGKGVMTKRIFKFKGLNQDVESIIESMTKYEASKDRSEHIDKEEIDL